MLFLKLLELFYLLGVYLDTLLGVCRPGIFGLGIVLLDACRIFLTAQWYITSNVLEKIFLTPHKAKGIVRPVHGVVIFCVCFEMSFSFPRLKTRFVRIIFAERLKTVFKFSF